jgi:hypothetical protein
MGNAVRLALVVFASCLVVSNSYAKVSPEVANKLGTTLTHMGAIKEGNADGSIPPFSGHILGAPDWVDYKGSGTHFPDPYPGEKPLYTITSSNYMQYADKLTDGQKELFRKYSSFAMPVYETKRDFRYSDRVRENTKMNAMSTTLISEGNGVGEAFHGVPFPIPTNGLHLIWNHQGSPNYESTDGALDSFAVSEGGTLSQEQWREERYILYYSPTMGRQAFNAQPYGGKVMVQNLVPARKKGEIILVHEFRDVTEASRNAWQYLPGTRRVRRAPNIAYDFPIGVGGLRTVDDALLFNGATDRYTWKMEPSRELYVPYNNNKLDDTSLAYQDFLKPHHIDPKVMRYELRRCWVVVGELKADKRHIYGKRRIYIDEDSWKGVLADNYDSRGNLWRTNMRTKIALYDMPGIGPRVEIYHDLQKNAYMANYLMNELKGPPKVITKPWSDNYFTTQMVRKLGRR